jgi:hypothetical protein
MCPTVCDGVPHFFSVVTFRATPRSDVRVVGSAELVVSGAPTEKVTMTSVAGGGNYISDSDIMAWLAQQQDRIYGELRDSLQVSKGRAEFADAINNIKTALHQANEKSPPDFSGVNQQLQELLKTYGSDPSYADLCKGLEQLADPIQARVQGHLDYLQASRDYVKLATDFVAAGGSLTGLQLQPVINPSDPFGAARWLQLPKHPTEPPNPPFDDGQLKTFDDLLGGKLDLVNKNDQLNMIHIQQLKALADQGSQLGSQFIGSSDKTSSAIINNIA